jgi:hypothetical protein
MKKYIKQLLTDLKNIRAIREEARERYIKGDLGKDKDGEMQAMFEEVERYVSEDPKETLGQHCGLEKVQFPKGDLLTDKACVDLTEALDRLYFAFNVDANIPERLPIRVRYAAMVELLDKRVFLDWFGTTTFEHCGYDYEGICPFGVSQCDCRLDWAYDIAVIIQKPEEEWFDTDAMEFVWGELLSRFDLLVKAFENAKTPNKVAVMQLLRQLAEARLLLKDAVLYYSPKEEEMPDGDFVPFFETLGVGKVVFPKVEVLAEMELELLTIALHFLFGKGFHSEHFVEWDLVRQYREFVAHWSRWGKVDDSVDYLLFKMQPQEETIFDKVRKPSKYKSYSDYIMAGLPKSEEGGDELPF